MDIQDYLEIAKKYWKENPEKVYKQLQDEENERRYHVAQCSRFNSTNR
jgi:CO dehydrogenase/acetyl-CoA synthase beta subunit